MYKLLITLLALISIPLFAGPLTPAEKREELVHLSTLIRSTYGPYEYKTQHLKISLENMVEKYAAKAEKASNVEFYYLINQFVAEFKDSHFSARIKTNLISKLGFIADRVEGKALIDEIDRRQLPESIFPFERGDEILSIDGKPVDEVIAELGSYLGSGYVETNKRSATMLLGYRSAQSVPPQYGTSTVTLRHGTSNLVDTVELKWRQIGDPFLENEEHEWSVAQAMDYNEISIFDYSNALPKTEKSIRCSGSTRVQIPKDATVIMRSPFVAYYHPTEKGNVGYLRIPHYIWKSPSGESENDFRFKQYEWVISELEKNTVGLIIDQDHNCGGSVDHLQKMVSLFVEKPFKAIPFQFLATRSEYFKFKGWVNAGDNFTLDGIAWLEVLDLVKTSWLKGERMSPKTSFLSDRLIQPNRVNYSKPIVMLIDEMSGSGGDAFPAMMQGLGRATLMGTRTMGAGGHVEEAGPLYYSANTIRLTKSLFFHPNGTAIENNGATPDISYSPTRNDFMYEYREYQQAYLKVLMDKL